MNCAPKETFFFGASPSVSFSMSSPSSSLSGARACGCGFFLFFCLLPPLPPLFFLGAIRPVSLSLRWSSTRALSLRSFGGQTRIFAGYPGQPAPHITCPHHPDLLLTLPQEPMPERASGWGRNHIYLLFTWSRTPTHCTPGALYGCLHGPVAHIGRMSLCSVQHAPPTHYQPQCGRGADCPARWCATIKSRRRRASQLAQLLWRRLSASMIKSTRSSL